MTQGYLSSDPGCSVRVRVHDDAAELNIKSATLGIERAEFEFPIPASEAREMLETFCGDNLVSKTRYFVPYAGHTWEIDVFDGLNDGLVVAEIELGASDEPFSPPPWLGQEVSNDTSYYNLNLIDHPFCDW
jgi:adenylate cyclase